MYVKSASGNTRLLSVMELVGTVAVPSRAVVVFHTM